MVTGCMGDQGTYGINEQWVSFPVFFVWEEMALKEIDIKRNWKCEKLLKNFFVCIVENAELSNLPQHSNRPAFIICF